MESNYSLLIQHMHMITLLFKLHFKLFVNRAIAQYYWLMALNNTGFCFKGQKHKQLKSRQQRRWISSSKTGPKEHVYALVNVLLINIRTCFEFVLKPCVLSLCSKVLVVGGYKGWLLWEGARNFPCVWCSQCQMAPRQTLCCPRLGPTVTMLVPQGQHNNRKKQGQVTQDK